MKTVSQFAATEVQDHFAPAMRAGRRAPVVSASLAALAGAGVPAGEEMAETAIVDALCAVLAALTSGDAPGVHREIAAMPADYAAHAFDLLIASRFPEGSGDTATLDDATLLCLVGLMAASGRREQAQALLAGEVALRRSAGFLQAAWWARATLLGRDASPEALWQPCAEGWPDVNAAQEAITAQPMRIEAHRALGRRLAEEGRFEGALAAFATGLALPLGSREKMGIGGDLAVLAVRVASDGQAQLLGERRVRAVLAANAAVARHAAALLRAEPGLRALADAEAWDAVLAMFDGYGEAAVETVSAYPIGADGKPHVNMIFLEITNYCNQKCTFCPDMHRENERTWLPLARVKELIDQIADTMTCNMLQLNAYGEPLLHPNIDEILAYVRDKKMPWPTFFTTHGMTLVDKKLKQLSRNYPTGIAVSLHNDSQESYQVSRNNRIGDYDTMVSRVGGLMRQMCHEGADCHLRLYQMVCNGHEDQQVPPEVRGAFAHDPERFARHVRKWERMAAEIAADAPHAVRARALSSTRAEIEHAFFHAVDDCGVPLPILEWFDGTGQLQQCFMSARPVETYANLLLEYHPDWKVERRVVNQLTCRFLDDPSLTIFATGRLGFCCLDMNNTGTFGSLDDYGTLVEAITSPEARRMIAELTNGVALSPGCQICLGTGVQQCKG